MPNQTNIIIVAMKSAAKRPVRSGDNVGPYW
jgi:hypothetical protein